MLQGLESLIGSFGLVVGVTYLVGGLIVNLNLSQYGVTEYQIVRVKYLAVGVTFLLNSIWNLLPAVMVAFGLLAWLPLQGLWTIAVVSLLAGMWLLWLWAHPSLGAPSGRPRGWRVGGWRFWVVVTAVAWVYPLSIALRQSFVPQMDAYSILLVAVAVMVGMLACLGQTYYYARFIYGNNRSLFGGIDPIGSGQPVRVKLSGKPEDIEPLQSLGVPLTHPGLTDVVMLIDETDTHYLIGIPQQARYQAVKVVKDIVRAILYLN